jgi:hypothetical protein
MTEQHNLDLFSWYAILLLPEMSDGTLHACVIMTRLQPSLGFSACKVYVRGKQSLKK